MPFSFLSRAESPPPQVLLHETTGAYSQGLLRLATFESSPCTAFALGHNGISFYQLNRFSRN